MLALMVSVHKEATIEHQNNVIDSQQTIAKYAKAHNAYQSEIMELQQGYAELWKQYSKLLGHLAKLVAL